MSGQPGNLFVQVSEDVALMLNFYESIVEVEDDYFHAIEI
jgi:hypothetical protein